MGFRSFLYWLARLLRDYNAVRRGRASQRTGRRFVGQLTGRTIGKLFRW